MPRFKSKPCEIRAEQWFPGKDVEGVYEGACGNHFVITIHHQKVYLEPGDWVVTEPGGERHYPVKPEVFEKRWEAVDEGGYTPARLRHMAREMFAGMFECHEVVIPDEAAIDYTQPGGVYVDAKVWVRIPHEADEDEEDID